MATTTTTNAGDNRSDTVLDSVTIERLIQLYEDLEAWPDYFIEKCCVATMDDSSKEDIRKNFPFEDHFRKTLNRMALSIPGFKWAAKKGIETARAEELLEMANEISERRLWEGEKSLWGAMPAWRGFTLLTGDIFVKLPKEQGICYPERMAAQDASIKGSKISRKQIGGFLFKYFTGDDQLYTAQGQSTNSVTEEITAEEWTRTQPGHDDEVKKLSYGFIPVAHLAWEEREGHPRGLPLSLRLVQCVCRIYAILWGIRSGNKLNSFPVGVLINSTSSLTKFFPGLALEIDDKAQGSKADFKFVGGDLNLDSLQKEFENAERALCAAAFLPYEGKEGASGIQPASGRAMERLSAGQIAYRVSYLVNEQSFLEDLIFKTIKIEGKEGSKDLKRGDIIPQYDDFTFDQLAKAEKLFAEGFVQEALRVLGYDEDRVAELMKEREVTKRDELGALFGKSDPGAGDDMVKDDKAAEDTKPDPNSKE